MLVRWKCGCCYVAGEAAVVGVVIVIVQMVFLCFSFVHKVADFANVSGIWVYLWCVADFGFGFGVCFGYLLFICSFFSFLSFCFF